MSDGQHRTAETARIDSMEEANEWIYRQRLKRVLDVVIALAALVVFSLPMSLILALNVIIYRRIFYVDKRVSAAGKVFLMVKFRTMDDNQVVTVLGAVLRYTALDELPQLYHVLQGHMSLIGPRPHTVEQHERMMELPGYTIRLMVRPGMTGLAQLRGHFDTDEMRQHLLRSDAEYVQQCSFLLDLGILFRTLAVFFTGH